MALGSTSGSGISVPDPHTTIDNLVHDLELGATRLWWLRQPIRRDHPSTAPAINVALDDIADTVARLRDLL